MFLARNLTLNVAAAPNYKYVFSKRLETLESKSRRSEVKTFPKRKKKKKKKWGKNIVAIACTITTTTTTTTTTTNYYYYYYYC